jgi:hypothetical protein
MSVHGRPLIRLEALTIKHYRLAVKDRGEVVEDFATALFCLCVHEALLDQAADNALDGLHVDVYMPRDFAGIRGDAIRGSPDFFENNSFGSGKFCVHGGVPFLFIEFV